MDQTSAKNRNMIGGRRAGYHIIDTRLFFSSFLFSEFELKPVRMIMADTNLYKFQYKIIRVQRKPTLNMREFKVALPMNTNIHLAT